MQTPNPIISFCLPVYNVHEYIEPCIESLYAQNLDAFEIICVDDCSTDGSLEELYRLAAMYPSIKIIPNSENRGVSYSRNKAMQVASGEYIWFVDPDDLLAPDVVNKYLKIAHETKAEAVLGNLLYFYDGTEPHLKYSGGGDYKQIEFYNPKDFYVAHDQSGHISFGVWLGLFSKTFLVEKDIHFEESLAILEDYAFYFTVGLKSSNIIHVDYVGYFYRVRSVSLSHGNTASKNYKKQFVCASIALDLYNDHRHRPEYTRFSKSIDAHITQMSEFAAIFLAAVTDSKYVRLGLSELKTKGYYPYHYTEEAAFVSHRKLSAFVIKRVLPYEGLFWAFHISYKLRQQIIAFRSQ